MAGDLVAAPRDHVEAVVAEDRVQPLADALFAARRDPLCPVGGIEGVVHLDERLVPLVGVLVGTDLDGASFSVRERCGGSGELVGHRLGVSSVAHLTSVTEVLAFNRTNSAIDPIVIFPIGLV